MRRVLIYILKILSLVVMLIFSITAGWATLSSAPWVPTRGKDLKRLKKVMKVKKGEVVYDLGCGDGRLCLYLAKHTPAKKIIGIELSYFYYLLAKIKVIFHSASSNIAIQWGNFFHKRIDDADKVFIYLTSRTSGKLIHRVFKDLRLGAMVFAYNYPIPGWEHSAVDRPSKKDRPIYVYTVGKEMNQVMFDG